MDKIKIVSRWNSERVLFECDAPEGLESGLYMRHALEKATQARADLRGAYLRGANLSDAYLSDANLSDAYLSGADLSDANLSDAYLSGADLSDANLSDADLRGANLSGADLRGAYLSGAPALQNIHQAVYDAASKPGALDMGAWHCGTSHCRAGWVVTLAGDEGKALEEKMGTAGAAMAIYMASDPDRWKKERLPNFYCGNDEALADMKRLAQEEANASAA